MKIQKLLVIAASVCLLAVFVSGPAYARSPLEIAQEFCDEVDDAAEEATEELAEAAGDLQECREDVQDCSGGFINREPVECIRDFNQCVDRAYEDAAQACRAFQRRLEDAYDDALRRARRQNQRTERRVQTLLANRLREECFAEAVAISRRCARRLQD